MFDNFLPKALFISLTVHTVFICGNFLLWHTPQARQVQKAKGVEITYKAQARKKTPDVRERPIKPVQQLDLKSSMSNPMDGSIPMKLGKESKTLSKDFMMYERKPQQIRSAEISSRVSVTQIKSEKVNNPAYAAYSEMLHNRIEDKVYENYRKMDAGVVYLTFIVSSDGVLRAAQIIEEKTNASQNLKDMSLKSLREAQFPPFLKGMTLPEYTFNIEIQYQVKD